MSIPDSIAARMLAELDNELTATRKMIERLPADKFGWKPHEKSMTLGRLAGHLSEMFRWIPLSMETEGLDFTSYPFPPKQFGSTLELLEDFDEAVAAAKKKLIETTESDMSAGWTMRNGEHVFCTLPKAVIIRTWVFNHIYHHRGQLSVYMRLLDIPVPSIYGPSADERP